MLAQFQWRRAAEGLRRAVRLVLDNGADSRQSWTCFLQSIGRRCGGMQDSARHGSRPELHALTHCPANAGVTSQKIFEGVLPALVYKLERLALKANKSYLLGYPPFLCKCSSIAATQSVALAE